MQARYDEIVAVTGDFCPPTISIRNMPRLPNA